MQPIHLAAQGGHLSTVETLITEYGVDPNAAVSTWLIFNCKIALFLCVYLIAECPIHGAASSGKLDVIIELIEKHGVNPKCKTGKAHVNWHVFQIVKYPIFISLYFLQIL